MFQLEVDVIEAHVTLKVTGNIKFRKTTSLVDFVQISSIEYVQLINEIINNFYGDFVKCSFHISLLEFCSMTRKKIL